MTEVRPGTFLVASPTLHDPNFARTVVLICEHTDQGSMGLVVNRPSTMRLPEALAGVAPDPLPDAPLYLGGPVQRQALLALHRLPTPVPGAQEVAEGISIGGDMPLLLAALGRILAPGATGVAGEGGAARGDRAQIRFYAGYAGWGAGQLAAELETGSWIVCPAIPAEVFASDVTQLWEAVLRRLGPEFARLITVPIDPRVN